MAETAIEWTERTLNLWSGCTKVDPACGFCYIERTPPLRIAGRKFERGDIPLRFHLERLAQPLGRRKPTMYFVNSISDTFHEDVPDEYIAQLFAMMARCPQHTFQILTKRIERARDLLGTSRFWNDLVRDALRGSDPNYLSYWPVVLPLPNVWVGATIGTRKFIHRADVLRDTLAAVRFISAEPLLTPLVAHLRSSAWPCMWLDRRGKLVATEEEDYGLDLTGIDWLIVGGESGAHLAERPYRFLVDADGRPREDRAQWARDLRDACLAQRPARIPTAFEVHAQPALALSRREGLEQLDRSTAFFFKQWGGRTPKSGGRELDGRTWDEMPTRVPSPVS